MKLGIHTITTNRRFQKSLRRIQDKLEALKVRLAAVEMQSSPYESILLRFVDETPDLFRITRRGKGYDIYEVDVGYDFSGTYPPDDDVLVIQLLEKKLEQVIESSDAFGDKRENLLRVISDWTTESVGA